MVVVSQEKFYHVHYLKLPFSVKILFSVTFTFTFIEMLDLLQEYVILQHRWCHIAVVTLKTGFAVHVVTFMPKLFTYAFSITRYL